MTSSFKFVVAQKFKKKKKKCTTYNNKRSNLVSFTTAFSKTLIICIFSFNSKILIFHFYSYFVFCKKGVKHRETRKFFVAMGAATFRWKELRGNSLSISCHIITAKDSLFRHGFFTLDMLHLPQKNKTIIQWLSYRFVPLIFTLLNTWLKWGAFRDKEGRSESAPCFARSAMRQTEFVWS